MDATATTPAERLATVLRAILDPTTPQWLGHNDDLADAVGELLGIDPANVVAFVEHDGVTVRVRQP